MAPSVGTSTSNLAHRCRSGAIHPIRLWRINLLARRPRKVAAVALANKMARTLWAMMVSGEIYRRPLAA